MKTWRDIEELSDRASLSLLIEQHGTPTRIGRAIGCSKESVKHAMKHHGLTSKQYLAGEHTRKRLGL